ncbi:transcriptional regulator [Streptomyces spongiicola]|uniref:Transcriptional regulator n=1 Tax=Streptomyces spongiicola TaxID=1690221 RepID=A0A2S1Z8D6_9ACTN|nr:transposase [Streptomyces spongiicola]AWK12614.1 transcriptional regulator [Streptomyces spongiicola]GBQ03506.1 transcriptional regulator [Streptomyces spongiicola]
MGAYALTATRTSLPVFAERIFECLPRADQRRWAQAYVQSLLTTSGKKSVRRLAAAISSSPATSQSLHQFVNASPWDWMPVRAELTRWAEQQMTPRAWVLGQAVLRKRGEHSCGVHRRFLPSTGRSVTCQLGVGVFLSSYDQALPVDWRLLLPGSWTRDPGRRVRTRIPDGVGPRSVEQHALDLVDALTAASRTAPLPVVADLEAVGGTSAEALVRGLALRGRDFAVAVPDTLQVAVGRHLRLQPPHGGDGRGLVLAARSLFEFDAGTLTRMESVAPRGGRGRHTTVMSSFVRLPQCGGNGERGGNGDRIHRTYRLLATRSESGRRPLQLWLTSLTHARTDTLLALTRTLGQAGRSVREMSDEFGLLDFEGRSYPGWHHHMSLVSAAYAYSRMERLPAEGGERMLAAA